MGAIDLPLDAISRVTGGIFRSAVSRSGRIDPVEIFVDARSIGYAELCIPREDIEGDSAEAQICGFPIKMHPEHLADHNRIDVGFAVHLVSGEVHSLPSRVLPLRHDRA